MGWPPCNRLRHCLFRGHWVTAPLQATPGAFLILFALVIGLFFGLEDTVIGLISGLGNPGFFQPAMATVRSDKRLFFATGNP